MYIYIHIYTHTPLHTVLSPIIQPRSSSGLCFIQRGVFEDREQVRVSEEANGEATEEEREREGARDRETAAADLRGWEGGGSGGNGAPTCRAFFQKISSRGSDAVLHRRQHRRDPGRAAPLPDRPKIDEYSVYIGLGGGPEEARR
jgi:hypothetical protein